MRRWSWTRIFIGDFQDLLWVLRVRVEAIWNHQFTCNIYRPHELGVCRTMLDRSMIVFIDDILVYSKCREKHKLNLCEVLKTLTGERLYAKLSKCELWSCEVQFLGHIINQKGILVDPDKIEVVMWWEVSRTPSEI